LSNTVIIAGLICLVLGALIGIAIFRIANPQNKKRREMGKKLQETEQKFKDYQHDVTEHFIKTSGLINNLTQSYREVHEHMVSSAMHLTNPDISRQLSNAGAGTLIDSSSTNKGALPSEMPEPPKDYAPKAPEGILSETYGLSDETTFTSAPAYGFDATSEGVDKHDDDPTLKTT
jgi:uncharacterized membrane-anchored protein YhcB (DUF1043 family)